MKLMNNCRYCKHYSGGKCKKQDYTICLNRADGINAKATFSKNRTRKNNH